jgi:hypothetical protein
LIRFFRFQAYKTETKPVFFKILISFFSWFCFFFCFFSSFLDLIGFLIFLLTPTLILFIYLFILGIIN